MESVNFVVLKRQKLDAAGERGEGVINWKFRRIENDLLFCYLVTLF